MEPRDEEAYSNLCGAYNMLGNFMERLNRVNRPSDQMDVAGAHNNLAWSYQKLGRYAEGIDVFPAGIKISRTMLLLI